MKEVFKRPDRIRESGNIVVLILIAIGLFAALGVAFMQGTRSSTTLLTDEQSKTYARHIIAYGNDVRQAVKRLSLRGCSDTEISFENDTVSGYTNPNAPDDNSCHVFHVKGGGLNWQTPDESWLDSDNSGNDGYNQYFFPDLVRVIGFGEDCANNSCTDLLIELPHIKLEICNAINDITGTNGTAGDTIATGHNYATGDKFAGTYAFTSSSDTSTYGDGEAWLTGESTGCLYRGTWSSGGNPYVYYQVILSR